MGVARMSKDVTTANYPPRNIGTQVKSNGHFSLAIRAESANPRSHFAAQ